MDGHTIHRLGLAQTTSLLAFGISTAFDGEFFQEKTPATSAAGVFDVLPLTAKSGLAARLINRFAGEQGRVVVFVGFRLHPE